MTKKCSICGTEKSVADFSRFKHSRDGLRAECKRCQAEYNKRYYARNTASADSAAPPQTQVCKKCDQTLDIVQFHRHRRRKAGYSEICKECQKQTHRNYYLRNTEKVKATVMNRAAANPGPIRERVRAWRIANPERARLNSRQNRMRRLARIAGNTTGKVSYAAILERDGYVCHICKGDVAPSDLHYDHVIPISRGGPHAMANIKVAHAVCNVRKANKLLTLMTATATPPSGAGASRTD